MTQEFNTLMKKASELEKKASHVGQGEYTTKHF